jgi:hypothetical protein
MVSRSRTNNLTMHASKKVLKYTQKRKPRVNWARDKNNTTRFWEVP